MENQYTLIPDFAAEISIPENGILSRTLHDDDHCKIIAFGFASGEELSAHTAPMPAVLHFIQGEASLRLGKDVHDAKAGTVVYMAPYLEHGIQAKTPVVLLLVLIKTP